MTRRVEPTATRRFLVFLGGALAVSVVFCWAWDAWSKHLLHQVPPNVATDIRKDCEEKWPSSAFTQGWCMDQEAALYLEGSKPTTEGSGPDLLVKPPDIIIRPPDDKDQPE